MHEWQNMTLSEKLICGRMTQLASINEPCAYQTSGVTRTIWRHLLSLREDIKRLLGEILEYKEYLSCETIIDLEKIRECTYFQALNIFCIPLADTPQNRNEIGKELYRQILNSKRLLSTFC